ncbi:MAG: bis(5'-nucleosyl)-tetraphosphatase (symmetrical) YqeK [Christensenella sp.]|nr:bis(5'-nucleosyl)-tetraphosphatase (symmetrical) YqeK [Christensenella sp.]MEA5002446.1 bis(5'-nucleosyl)-tetraphosphatase (symmetrical) YqeK [Christensenella sp.]
MDYTAEREKIVNKLAQKVKGEKFDHSLGVEQTALALARRYGADREKAGLAGLLHDYTKQMDNVAMAEKYGIPYLTEKTLHGHTAAALLKEKGYVTDEEVLGAIRWHTTGRAGMSLLEKIVFIADYVEPNRDFPGVELARELAFADIDKAVLLVLKTTIGHVVKNKGLIDTDSVEAYNDYRRLFPGEEI